ncbi:beta-glucosidase [Fusarium denticulatum]|uniref:beta-glucosidase n=1 Tax=Fusarium denticulatum TaxID=48507 RepID=A0A8H5XE21_9HYPO|nr:beta-glucosidase [Fusarium denticulatum]
MSSENKADYPWEISREVERLQKQHAWVQRCLDSKIVFAPIPLDKEGLRILDVGCADGVLLRDLKKQVSPSAQLVGADIVEAFLPASERGIRFEVYDLCESPREQLVGAFDLTHMRYSILGAAKVGYQKAIDNLASTAAPRGWLQVHELDFDLTDRPNVGPAWRDVSNLIAAMFDGMGMGSDCIRKLPGAFEVAGLENVTVHSVDLPMGKLLGDDEAAELSWQPFVITIPSLLEGAKALGVQLPNSTYENLAERFEKEVKEKGAMFRALVTIGQKPAAIQQNSAFVPIPRRISSAITIHLLTTLENMAEGNFVDVEALLSNLTLDEKVELLAGQGSFRMTGLEKHGIPALITSDGPHGIRGRRSFNRMPSPMLPSATGMGATFNTELIHKIGSLLGEEAKVRGVHVLLAPTLCLQRSPLIGRGFEAFGEDPFLSGTLGAHYINGVQEQGVATSVKHYAAHDQSDNSIEDNVVMIERTLREVHMLPFQLALRGSDPWTIMTSYNKINGIHVSEDPLLMKEILREEWGFKGLVMSDWFGTYSTSEAINAGLDLEMPGPTDWRGKRLSIAVNSRKVSEATVDTAVKNVLNLVNKCKAGEKSGKAPQSDTPEQRALIRQLVAESVVLLKNDKQRLPIKNSKDLKFGLIGDHVKNPALCGGGSAEVEPYYGITPYEAIKEVVGEENITYTPGCNSFRFSPLIKGHTPPDSDSEGWSVEIFGEDPQENPNTKVLVSTTAEKQLVDVPESYHASLPTKFYARAKAKYTIQESGKLKFGFSTSGKGKLLIDGKEAIDLWTSQPPKTDSTPCFNRLSMERFYEGEFEKGQVLNLEVLQVNESLSGGVGTAQTLAGRVGIFELYDEDQGIKNAVELAKKVDVPIVITGLSSDFEYEGSDRKHLRLPGRVDELISAVLEANPDAIIITQSGLPIEMPWESQAATLLHAWFGGQETGHGMADVLFGKVNPSGRLSLTFPKSVKHTPAYLTFSKADYDIVYGEGVFIGHRYYEMVDREPLFYFGHGLSYSKFEYSNLTVPKEFTPAADHQMRVTVDITNKGAFAGAEVVQLYIHHADSSLQRPVRELKAFTKVTVDVDETKTAELTLDKYSLSFWDQEASKWKAEAGKYTVILASSSNPKDEIARADFALPKTFFWKGL